MIVDNPNVSTSPERTVQRITLSSVLPATEDALADMCEFPEFRNANVTEFHANGMRMRRIYDANGTVIDTERLGVFAASSGDGASPGRSLAWKWIATPGAAAFLVIGLVAARAGHRDRTARN